ncbi:MAG: hypothetical protein ACM3L8_08430, partial [Verrucomicrobiota bacterium]
MKTVSFYPPDHPTLIQSLSKIVLSFEDIPLPETGLEIAVTRGALLHNDTPLPGTATIRALSDLNRELFVRRAARIIFLPNLKPEEVFSFLKIITLDADQVLDSGGLEQALLAE